MTTVKFLISGASGDTGGATARLLLASGSKVHALVHSEDDRSQKLRDLGAEIFVGDFLDFNAMREAAKGMQRAYFC